MRSAVPVTERRAPVMDDVLPPGAGPQLPGNQTIESSEGRTKDSWIRSEDPHHKNVVWCGKDKARVQIKAVCAPGDDSGEEWSQRAQAHWNRQSGSKPSRTRWFQSSREHAEHGQPEPLMFLRLRFSPCSPGLGVRRGAAVPGLGR